jgi:deoxycytidine triphosphate deaminase
LILCNRSILRAIAEGRLKIDPRPPSLSFNTTAVDLTLGRGILIPKDPAPAAAFDLGGLATVGSGRAPMADTLRMLFDSRNLDTGGFTILPRGFLLAQTAERIALPLPRDRTQRPLAARIEGGCPSVS